MNKDVSKGGDAAHPTGDKKPAGGKGSDKDVVKGGNFQGSGKNSK